MGVYGVSLKMLEEYQVRKGGLGGVVRRPC